MVDVQVVGARERAMHAAAMLRSSGLSVRLAPYLPSAAGLPNRGALTLLLWRPGHDPVLEEALFADGTPSLHCWWGDADAEVGPFVVSGAGPCPRCQRCRQPLSRSESPTLRAWALSWASLQAQAYLAHGTSELIGAQWSWSLGDPGLTSTTWHRQEGCPTPGCGPL
ncbi:hypothetical protein [Tessaracoccus caeni]|uniref:hypothetical protein n=1 Tax=Tessaracoccus caeni TaxID=3031239 RepID=UPI0023DA5CF6|nr:hypothetical protein [Tessaracoccus caeni]MDF1486790.1 hypothetical protein [Tessaracoccus caeni]